MNRLPLLAINLLSIFLIYSQIIKAQPEKFDLKENSVPFVTMPSFDIEKFKNDIEKKRNPQLKKMYFAKNFDVNYNLTNSGNWIINSKGIRIWRLGIVSTGAYSINLLFNRFILDASGELFVYNPSQQNIQGPFTIRNTFSTDIFPIAPIPGDSIIIEYRINVTEKSKANFTIAQVSHDYKGFYNKLKDSRYGLSESCEININCPEGDLWQKEKKAVCRLLINGNTFCTGTLINNTRNDGTPYIITANHCLSTELQAKSVVAVFNYESPNCTSSDGSTIQNISGAELIATTSKLDFCLIKLKSLPSFIYSTYYVGWSKVNSNPYYNTCIHHPQGDIKKISIDNNSASISNFGNGYDNSSHWLISNWENGVTEKGSSGAPLFDSNHRLVGTLTGGDANCSNPLNDYFACFHRSWADYSSSNEQLRTWLDPISSNVNFLNGFDPLTDACDTLNNVGSSEIITINKLENPQWGYQTGHNSDSVMAYAEKMTTTKDSTINAIYIFVGKAHNSKFLSSINLNIWNGKNIPDSLVYSKNIYIRNLSTNTWNYIKFDSTIHVSKNFFIGYSIDYNNADTFAVYHVKQRTDTLSNKCYIYHDSTWKPIYKLYNLKTSLAFQVVNCVPLKATIFNPTPLKAEKNKDFLIYPNPSNGKITIEIPNFNNENYTLSIYNLNGQELEKINFSESIILLNLSNYNAGNYICKLICKDNVSINKIIIQKE